MTRQLSRKPKGWSNTICLDFDGVICEFGNEREGQPVEGLTMGLHRLIKAGWHIEVYSGRSKTAGGIRDMQEWFSTHVPSVALDCKVGRISFASCKPTAKIYVDDRGFHFTGWDSLTPEVCESFRAWWQHPDSTE